MSKPKPTIQGHPAGNLVLIRKFTKQEYMTLKSGVIISEDSEKQPDKGEVLLVGDEVKKAKPGNIVLFNQSYGSGAYDLRINGEECVILKEEAIMFYIKNK